MPSSWRSPTPCPRGPGNSSAAAETASRPAARLPGLLLASSLRKPSVYTAPQLGWGPLGLFPLCIVTRYRHRLSQRPRGRSHTQWVSPRILLLELSLRTDHRSIAGGPVAKTLPAKAGGSGSVPGKTPNAEERLSPCTTLLSLCPRAWEPRWMKPRRLEPRQLMLTPRPLKPRPLEPELWRATLSADKIK